VTLQSIDPPIWRRIQVWEDVTLAQFHRVLQMVVGWEDCHLYEFWISGSICGVADLDDERTITDVKRTRIHDVIQHVGTDFEYVYDLGITGSTTYYLRTFCRRLWTPRVRVALPANETARQRT
jgi:hypothetical protein